MLGKFLSGSMSLLDFVTYSISIILALSVHEFSHAYAAYKLGDNTANEQGRLTLNPLSHLDIFGTIMLFLWGFGWAKPVPINPVRFSRRYSIKTGMSLTALAGPLSNFVFAFVSVLLAVLFAKTLYGVMPLFIYNIFYYLFSYLAVINIGLGLFNLVPLPPLDGSKIIAGILPSDVYYRYMQIERYGFIILIVLINTPFFNFLNTMRYGLISAFERAANFILFLN